MELYILRHGDAVDRLTGGYARDEDRPLTDEGRAEALGVAGGLSRLGVSLDLLLTSPLVRAAQTAEVIASVMTVASGPTICPALASGDLREILAAARAGRRTMVVGHMPSLGELATWLAWGDPSLTLPLRTAGLCRVDLAEGDEPGQGDLRWLLPPRLAARLGRERP